MSREVGGEVKKRNQRKNRRKKTKGKGREGEGRGERKSGLELNSFTHSFLHLRQGLTM